MKETNEFATELRQKTNDLEQKIKSVIDEFHIEVGDCEVNIDTRYVHFLAEDGSETQVLTGVKITLTV